VTHENKQPKSKKPNYKQQPRRFQDKPVLTTSSTLHKGWKRTSQSLTFISAVTFLSTLASTTDIDFSETASIAFNQQSSSLSSSVFTVQGKLKELLLREDKFSLDKAIQIFLHMNSQINMSKN
jgi:hypothetical protein